MYVVLQEQVGAFSIEQQVALVVRIADYSIPSGITASILTAKGSMIVATAPGVPSETGGPSADGQVWTSDSAEPLGGRWAAPGGGGGDVSLTNKSGADQIAGTVVIHDADYDNSFKLTTTLRDRRVIGVLSEDIANGATGAVAVAGKIVTVKVQGNVSRGQWLIASATTGRAQADGYTRPAGTIGMALTAYAGGGAGTVSMLVAVDMYLGASTGKGYVMGGYTTTYVTTAQVLNFVNETTSIIAGAALTTARRQAGAGSGGTHGYVAGGTTGANSAVVDKCAFATDITAVAAAMATARQTLSNNINGSLAAYMMGGYIGAYSALTDATVFSTDITAAKASGNLSVARGSLAGYSSSITGYAVGGNTGAVSAVADAMPFATEITAAKATANLSTARSSLCSVYSSTDGYNLGGTTGAHSALAGKMPFASETNAAVASGNLSVARSNLSGLIASLAGYVMGGDSGAVSAVADRLTYSTDVTAAVASANLPTATWGNASLSTTNY